jgi:hypothetical protein
MRLAGRLIRSATVPPGSRVTVATTGAVDSLTVSTRSSATPTASDGSGEAAETEDAEATKPPLSEPAGHGGGV